MKLRRASSVSPLSLVIAFILLSGVVYAFPEDPPTDSSLDKQAASSHMSKQTRMDLIHAFQSELVYIRTPFPMGKKGLSLKDGKLTPNGQDLQQLIALWGPAVKPGDRVQITAIAIKNDSIHFEINGGPVKKQKWYQHVQLGMGGATTPVGTNDSNANPRGSYVDLAFDKYVPDLNPQQLKNLLRPVFDFNAKSAVEAYLETLTPKAQQAIKSHQVLVGMNREMVIYAKGRPGKKVREKDGETEYEDWIYGEPPQDVDFVRVVGDEVVRVEIMKVTGEKILRTEKEVDLEQPKVAKSSDKPGDRPASAPTLRRPGEEVSDPPPTNTTRSRQPVPPPDPGTGPQPN
jgi:hypothetical protein